MTYSIAIFIALAIITIGAAIAVVTLRNVFHAALMLVVAFFGVAGFYVLLEAGFFAAAQVLVYIGAISVLLIFSVMLTRGVFMAQARNQQSGYAAVAAGVMFLLIAALVGPIAINWPGLRLGGVPEAGCRGAALLAGLALGWYRDVAAFPPAPPTTTTWS
jgi:NADH-quinone oxidoreductase subunit J